MSIVESPLTLNDTEWDTDAVIAYCFARVTMTDEEWEEEDPEWEMSREDAATRIDEEDWSPPEWYQGHEDR